MAVQLEQPGVVHVRFDGRSFDVPLFHLHLNSGTSDGEILRSVARHLEVPEIQLQDYVLDRHANGNLTVRPQAVFG